MALAGAPSGELVRVHPASSVGGATGPGILDAAYVSGVALTTHGFRGRRAHGDAAALRGDRRSAMSFALVTVSISWVPSIYPAPARRRSLAGRVTTLLERHDDRLVPTTLRPVLALVSTRRL